MPMPTFVTPRMNVSADIPTTKVFEDGFQLSTLRIDPRAGSVSGPGGQEKLDPKVMDVLVILAQHAGQVVLREDLMSRVWPHLIVTDDVLTRCIYELRKQLKRAAGSEGYKEILETIPKRGYRLAADVTAASSRSQAAPAKQWKWHLLALASVAAVVAVLAVVVGPRVQGKTTESRHPTAAAAGNSIAVLPFADMSATQDQRYLADGVAEEILNRLAMATNLRVISRTSSFSFRERPLNIADIAAKLNVSHVLEGSVRRAGDKVRITAQLISTSSDSHVWSATYDRAVNDLFAAQDEIATAVATALQAKLTEAARHGSAPVVAEAQERYLQGRYFYDRRAPGDFERSAKYFEEAVAIDPGYARAWAALSGAYRKLAWNGLTPDRDLQRRQGQAALRAVAIDPQLAVAHVRLSQYYTETGQFSKAEEHFRQAAALDPDDTNVLDSASFEAFSRGDIDGSLASQRRAVALDPLNVMPRKNLAVLLMACGKLDEAMSEFRRLLELSPDYGEDVQTDIVSILVLQQRYAEAKSAIDKFPPGKYRDRGIALLYQPPGNPAAADAALVRMAAQVREAGPGGDIMDTIRLAEVYVFRGMSKQAFTLLQEKRAALEQEQESGTNWVWYFQLEARVSPFLTPLHTDPRWAALITRPI